jgi:5-methylcytosine-specific restriction protein A
MARTPLKCIKPTIKTLSQSRGAELATVATKRITGRRCQQSRQEIAERDGYRCQMCGRLTTRYEIDHVVPLHLGGRDDSDNKQLLCIPCHELKSKAEGNARGGV